MFTNRVFRVLLIAAIALLAVNISPGAAEKLTFEPLMSPGVDPTDMGYAFTYQGRLLDGGSPADGAYDFQFKLFDDLSAGTQIGSTLSEDDHDVNDGLFMIDLDFGSGAYPGYERYLEISVRPGVSTGSYNILSPRQKLNPTPYSQYARDAGDAAHADDANHSNDADHADYADTIYNRTVVVKPVGTPAQNGVALLAALGTISVPSSSNRWLVKIEPGVYDIGAASVTMQPWVDIEGSGETTTLIKSTGFSVPTQGTVVGSSDAELRSLTLYSDGGPGADNYATAFYSNSAQTILIHVTLEAHNGMMVTNGLRGIYASIDLDNVTTHVTGGGSSCRGLDVDNSTLVVSDSNLFINSCPINSGVTLFDDSHFTMLDSQIEVTAKGAGFKSAKGIETNDSGTLIRNSRLWIDGNDTGESYGIWSSSATSNQIFESTVDVFNGDDGAYGLYLIDDAGLELANTKISVYDSSFSNTGIYEEDTPMTIRDSQVIAQGGATSTGIFINDLIPLEQEITRTHIRADVPGDAAHPGYVGVQIWSDGRVKFFRDTIEVEPFQWIPGPIPVGGTGIINDGGTITFENSTINSVGEEAFLGIVHKYYTDPATLNMLYVNNSEIYTCLVEPTMCNTIQATAVGPVVPQAFVYVGSSLLWGGNVSPGLPDISCQWVHDETYTGFGWPLMPIVDSVGGTGNVVPSYVCP